MPRRAPRPLHLLLALVVLAAALRLWRIGHQSYWLDEAFTVRIVRSDFAGMLDGVRHTESTPPLYYALAWLWERVFGWHEAGLRSLSAVFGVATVPAAYAAARELFSERAGLVAAGLFAVSPYFVWYSQEARAYSLLVLLCTLSLLYFVRAERDGRGLWKWGLVAALALLTHYFAAFLVAPEAAWLVWRHRSRAALLAAGGLLAIDAALLPLALAQKDTGHAQFIAELSFGQRLVAVPKKLATGELGTPTPAIGPLLGAVLVAGAVLALTATGPRGRRAAQLMLGLAAANLALALVLKIAGLDYLLPRNLIELFVPLMVAIAGGLAAVRLGVVAAAAVCTAGIALVIQVGVNPSVQRDDWRGLVRALGPTRARRLLVVTPEVGKTPLRLYAGLLIPIGVPQPAAEIDLLANARPPDFPPPPAPPGFRLAAVRATRSWELVRYAALAGEPAVGPFALRAIRLDRAKDAAVFLQTPARLPPP